MATIAAPTRMIGAPIKRREDPRLIQGLSHYVDDIKLVGTLHCAFLRSDYAHAAINSIDTSAAKELPGVVTVITAEDLGDVGGIPCGAEIPDLKVPDHPALAVGACTIRWGASRCGCGNGCVYCQRCLGPD